MNSRTERRYRLALILLIAVVLLGILAVTARAQGAWVFGIVQDENYLAVNGGDVWLERKWGDNWLIAPCCEKHPMEGHAFQFDIPQPGRYRVMYAKRGYVIEWIRYEEFDSASPPTTDIQINVKREFVPTATAAPTATPFVPTNTPMAATATATPWPTFPVPTTLYPPTVDPTRTATATATAAPCLEFQQFTQEERRSVIATALTLIGRPLESAPDVDNDPTLLHGLRDMLLGAPVTRRFEVTISGVTLTARGFCQAIVVMRPVSREECYDYGVVDYASGQNYGPLNTLVPG